MSALSDWICPATIFSASTHQKKRPLMKRPFYWMGFGIAQGSVDQPRNRFFRTFCKRRAVVSSCGPDNTCATS